MSVGLTSFLGGLASGFGNQVLQKKQQEQAQKDADKKMLVSSLSAGLEAGKFENPQAAFNLLTKTLGVKDKDGKLSNLISHAQTIVPQQSGHLDAPGHSIGLNTPEGQSIVPAGSDLGTSPGRSIGLTAPAAPADPNEQPIYTTPEQVEQRSLERARQSADLTTQREMRLADLKAKNAQALASTRSSGGAIAAGAQLPQGATDVNGLAIDPQARYKSIRYGDGHVEYEPVEAAKATRSPMNDRAAMLSALPANAGKSPAEIQAMAAGQLTTEANQKLNLYVTSHLLTNQLTQQHLADAQARGPLTAAAAQLRLDTAQFNLDQKKKLATGDPKTVLAWATGVASKLSTDPSSPAYGQNPVDVRDKFLSEQGFDPDDLLTRSKQVQQALPTPNPDGTMPKPNPASSKPSTPAPVTGRGGNTTQPANHGPAPGTTGTVNGVAAVWGLGTDKDGKPAWGWLPVKKS